MPLITWNTSYSVGVDVLDDDHKKLFDLINQLHDAMATGKGKATSVKIVKELHDYTVYHFNREEKMLQEAGSELLDMQKSEHKIFVQKVKDLETKIATGKDLSISIEISRFLKDWLSDHIKGKDQKYTSVLK